MLNFEDDNTNAQFQNLASAIDFVDCEREFTRITPIHANYGSRIPRGLFNHTGQNAEGVMDAYWWSCLRQQNILFFDNQDLEITWGLRKLPL